MTMMNAASRQPSRQTEKPSRTLAHKAGRSLLIMAALACTGGCQFLTTTNSPRPQQTSKLTSANYLAEAGHKFEVRTKGSDRTSRESLFRLIDALDSAYQILEFKPPYPAVRIVNQRHDHLPRGAVGVAVIDQNGREQILIERGYLQSGRPLLSIAIHELSHLKAWRQFGHEISAHGAEFRQVCRGAAKSSACAPSDDRSIMK